MAVGLAAAGLVAFSVERPSPSFTTADYTYGQGYLFVGSDGAVYDFGTSQYQGGGNNTCPGVGCHGQLDSSFTGAAYAPSGAGYWLIGPDGGVFAFPSTLPFYNSLPGCGITAPAPVIGIAPYPNGSGYWLVDQDGDVYSLNGSTPCGSTAPWYGNVGSGCGGGGRTASVVGLASTPDGHGYWIASSDGNVYNCGDAAGLGRVNNPAKPIAGIAAGPNGGYWLAGGDGGVFCFGNAGFHGSLPPTQVDNPIVGVAATADGGGYWLPASDGGEVVYGDAQFLGDMISSSLSASIVGIAAVP